MATTNLGKVSVTPKGEYDPLITYERLDVISHNGSSYIVKQASTGVTPIEGEFYALIAEKGDGGSFVKKAYKTYAAMDADKVNIPANSSVDVTNDPDESKNGAYIYDGVAFTRSQYDSKVVTDKIIADTAIAVQDAINNTAVEGGVLADTFVTMTASGEGAVARNLRDVNSDIKSIKDFDSAKTANDYAVIQDGKVYLPNESFTTDTDVDLTNFWGSGVITNTANNKVFSRPDSEYVMPEFFGITDEDATSGMHAALDKGYVRLKSGKTYKVNGTYSINGDITIDGNNATLLGSDNTILYVKADCTITIRNLKGNGFKHLIRNVGNFKVKVDIQGCEFTEVEKLIEFSTAGSLSFYLKGNKFSKMFSVIWAICPIKESLAEYNEFTEMANIATDPLATHMNVFRLSNGTSFFDSGLVVFRHNIFSDISGGTPAGSGYVVAIFAAVNQLICDGNVFEDIRDSDDAVVAHARAIYSYGFNDKVINNTFINAGRYEIVTIKGVVIEGGIIPINKPSIVSGNSFHQDFPLINGGLTVEGAYNVDISNNVWSGKYARVRVGGSGYQFGTVNFIGNNFNTVNAIRMSFINMRSLSIHSNILSRSDMSASVDDNVITLGSALGHEVDIISIKGNTIITPITIPNRKTDPRRFITIDNLSYIDRVVVRGNEFLGASPDWLPHTLLIEDAKDMKVIWSDNIVDNAMPPDITGGTFTSYNNIYDGVLETPEPPETPEPTP